VKKAKDLLLGFSVPDAEPVNIPLKHMAITGQTQEAGKTTALEALITRSGLRAVTFVTKRGESSFRSARRIDPYFREQADWQFVASILEASRSEKLKFERAWIIRASKGANTLAEVQRNVRNLMGTAKGMSADVYLTLDAYLEAVVPQIARVKWAHSVELGEGVNAVDLTQLNVEMQHLVIKSTIGWVAEREKNTIIVIPEAWKFIPEGRGTPVKLAAEAFIRQGAAIGNYLWLDSQDIAGVEKIILKSVPLWILGVQREANEVKRTLDNIPAGLAKPKAADVATLELGQFFACWGRNAIKTYVQPAWLPADLAKRVAKGKNIPFEQIDDHQSRWYGKSIFEIAAPEIPFTEEPSTKENDMSYDQKLADLEKENGELREQNKDLLLRIELLERKDTAAPAGTAIEPKGNPPPGSKVQVGPMNIDAIERALNITFSQETREFRTDGPQGCMMFCLVHDLKNKPSRESEISAAMVERGWNYSHQMLAPKLAELSKRGDLIKEGNTNAITYRIPGKLILMVDGKRVAL
jgi:hypothetical protein